jgi:regulator of protease activity HflC (stomatin/prohibitin superfamily)
MKIPLIHTIKEVNMKESSIPIGQDKPLQCFTADNVPVNLSGSLFFQIRDAFKSHFNVSNVDKNVSNIGTSAMRSIIGTFEYDDIIGDRNKLNIKLKDVIGDGIKNWGVDCTRFEIQSFEPSNSNIRKQLEQQMEAERNRRKNLLDTEAAVTVSDGMRRKTILESEGKLQEQRNHAEGEYARIVKLAESNQIALEMEADGLEKQIYTISNALNGNTTEAVKMLLEIKRMEQLKAIANGQNNTVYFIKDKNLQDGYMTDLVEKMKKQ